MSIFSQQIDEKNISQSSGQKQTVSGQGMKVVLEKSALLGITARQQGLINRRSPVPILSHLLLSAQEQTLQVSGTNLEMSLTEEIDLSIERPGKVAVSANLLYDIVRKLWDGSLITLEVEEPFLRVQSGSSEFRLSTLSAQEFPEIVPQALPYHLKMLPAELSKLIEATKFCIAGEDMHYTLSGICFRFYEEKFTSQKAMVKCHVVATDAHRLALGHLDASLLPLDVTKTAGSIVVGRKAIQEISKILESLPADESIDFGFSGQQISLEGRASWGNGRFQFFSRLLEGRFPDYMQAIPSVTQYRVALDPKKLAQSIERVGIVNDERRRLVKFQFQSNCLTLSAQSAQGFATEALDVNYQYPELDLNFNSKYIMDICHHIRGSEMVMQVKDAVSPVLFQDTQDLNTFYVLMPVVS